MTFRIFNAKVIRVMCLAQGHIDMDWWSRVLHRWSCDGRTTEPQSPPCGSDRKLQIKQVRGTRHRLDNLGAYSLEMSVCRQHGGWWFIRHDAQKERPHTVLQLAHIEDKRVCQIGIHYFQNSDTELRMRAPSGVLRWMTWVMNASAALALGWELSECIGTLVAHEKGTSHPPDKQQHASHWMLGLVPIRKQICQVHPAHQSCPHGNRIMSSSSCTAVISSQWTFRAQTDTQGSYTFWPMDFQDFSMTFNQISMTKLKSRY